jgi:hypothetical protein
MSDKIASIPMLFTQFAVLQRVKADPKKAMKLDDPQTLKGESITVGQLVDAYLKYAVAELHRRH